VYFSTDRIQHCLTKYLSPDHPEYAERSKDRVAERIRDVYRMLDEGLGRLLSRARHDDLVIFMSDHGFQPVTRALHLDRLLAHLRFLSFSKSNVVFGPMQWGPVRSAARKVYDLLGLHGRVALPQPVDWSATKAYTAVRSTGEGVSINLAGREAHGTVDPADYDKVRDDVAERLLAFTDPDTGIRPVARLWRREELYKGPYAEMAPDLILQAAPLFSLSHARSVVEPADWLSGEHRIEGVIAAAGPAVDPAAFAGTSFRLVDLAPTLLAALGVPSSVRHSGVPLSVLVGTEAAGAASAARIEDSAAGSGGTPGDSSAHDTGLDEDEADEVEDHLRGLGYLE
jgi:predicted AlkP superfamily phosphohydrolase/phosphomutase